MTERDRDNHPKDKASIFKVASKLAHGGVIQGGRSSFYRVFVGSYEDDNGEKQNISIELHNTAGHDYVNLYGKGVVQGSIHDNLHCTGPEQGLRASGEIPENIMEILTRVESDKEAMKELEEGYLSSLRTYSKTRNEAIEKLRSPHTPFWEAEKALESMHLRDAEFYVNHGRGKWLPFWVRKKFGGSE